MVYGGNWDRFRSERVCKVRAGWLGLVSLVKYHQSFQIKDRNCRDLTEAEGINKR